MDWLDFLFPRSCVGCGRSGQYFCGPCREQIKKATLICPACGQPEAFGCRHPDCRARLGLDGLISFFAYDRVIQQAIHQLKYRGVTDLLAELMAMVLEQIDNRASPVSFLVFKRFLRRNRPLLVPVPLHWYKYNRRGFNQAETIAEYFAKGFGLELETKLLVRSRSTISQTQLPRESRQVNVQDAFRVSPAAVVRSGSAVLVDDVWTTGSTLQSASRVLKKAGVKQVWGLTLAR